MKKFRENFEKISKKFREKNFPAHRSEITIKNAATATTTPPTSPAQSSRSNYTLQRWWPPSGPPSRRSWTWRRPGPVRLAVERRPSISRQSPYSRWPGARTWPTGVAFEAKEVVPVDRLRPMGMWTRGGVWIWWWELTLDELIICGGTRSCSAGGAILSGTVIRSGWLVELSRLLWPWPPPPDVRLSSGEEVSDCRELELPYCRAPPLRSWLLWWYWTSSLGRWDFFADPSWPIFVVWMLLGEEMKGKKTWKIVQKLKYFYKNKAFDKKVKWTPYTGCRRTLWPKELCKVVPERIKGMKQLSMHWKGQWSFFLLCTRRESIGWRFGGSILKKLASCQKSIMRKTELLQNSLKFPLRPKTFVPLKVNFWNAHSMGSSTFSGHQSEFWTFGNLETKSKDIGERQLIGWFCIFDCAVFCGDFYCRWTIYCLPKVRIFSGEVQFCWIRSKLVKMMRYDSPGWILVETRFSLCLETRQPPEVVLSGTESSLFESNLPRPNSFW